MPHSARLQTQRVQRHRSAAVLRQHRLVGEGAPQLDQINWQRLYNQCASVHMATFSAEAFRIARDYLGIDFDLPAPWEDSIDAEPLLHDTLCYGVYAFNNHTRLHFFTVR